MFYLSKWRWGRNSRRISHVISTIVAQARHPALYQQGAVADTIPGRVESILLHLCLVVHALRGQKKSGSFIAELYRVIFRHHLDPAMRELAIGDLSVPKQMRKLAEGIHGRGNAYAAALADADPHALEAVLQRNFSFPDFPQNFSLDSGGWLANYTRIQAAHLARLGPDSLMRDDWIFADGEQNV